MTLDISSSACGFDSSDGSYGPNSSHGYCFVAPVPSLARVQSYVSALRSCILADRWKEQGVLYNLFGPSNFRYVGKTWLQRESGAVGVVARVQHPCRTFIASNLALSHLLLSLFTQDASTVARRRCEFSCFAIDAS